MHATNITVQRKVHGGMDRKAFIKLAEKYLVDDNAWVPAAYDIWLTENTFDMLRKAGGASAHVEVESAPPPKTQQKPRAPPKASAAVASSSKVPSKPATGLVKTRKNLAEPKEKIAVASTKGKEKEGAVVLHQKGSGEVVDKRKVAAALVGSDSDGEKLPELADLLRQTKLHSNSTQADEAARSRKRNAEGSPAPSRRKKSKRVKAQKVVSKKDVGGEVDYMDSDFDVPTQPVMDVDDFDPEDQLVVPSPSPPPRMTKGQPKKKQRVEVVIDVDHMAEVRDRYFRERELARAADQQGGEVYEGGGESKQEPKDVPVDEEEQERAPEARRRKMLQRQPQNAVLVAIDPLGMRSHLAPTDTAKVYGPSVSTFSCRSDYTQFIYRVG